MMTCGASFMVGISVWIWLGGKIQAWRKCHNSATWHFVGLRITISANVTPHSICLKAVVWYLLHSVVSICYTVLLVFVTQCWCELVGISSVSPTSLLGWCVMCVCPSSLPGNLSDQAGAATNIIPCRTHKYNYGVGTNTNSKDSAEKSTRTLWTQNKVWKEGEGGDWVTGFD